MSTQPQHFRAASSATADASGTLRSSQLRSETLHSGTPVPSDVRWVSGEWRTRVLLAIRTMRLRSAFARVAPTHLCALGLALALPLCAQAGLKAGTQNCPFRPEERPNLSPDSIGSLGVVEQLSTLRALCPAARDTLVRFDRDARKAYPGLVF